MGGCLEVEAIFGQYLAEGALADHQPQGRFGGVLQSAPVGAADRDVALGAGILAGVVHPKQIVVQILDVVLHHHLDVDDVQVAADHLGFDRHRGVGAAAFAAAETELHPARLHHLHHIAVADRGRPPPMQAGVGDRVGLGRAEKPQRGLLAGADGVDAGGGPDNHDQGDNQHRGQADAAAAQPLDDAAQTAAQTAQHLVEIHFRWSWGLPSGLVHNRSIPRRCGSGAGAGRRAD